MSKSIKRALVSVYYKDNLEPIIETLGKAGVEFGSTGGTQAFIEKLGYPVTPVETLTGYPSIFGGRVKTLHPAVFGGILFRREDESDVKQAEEFNIGPLDIVIVDLYPFEETVAREEQKLRLLRRSISVGSPSFVVLPKILKMC